MPTKPLHNVPAKPRGLEAISIDRKELIKLLCAERSRQRKVQTQRVKDHKKEVVAVLSKFLGEAKNGGIDFQKPRRRYGDPAIYLPDEPKSDTCDWDHIIHRLTHDAREEVTLSSSEWNRLFPCEGVNEDE